MNCLQELVPGLPALLPPRRTGAGGWELGSPCPFPAQLPALGVHGAPRALGQLQWVRCSRGTSRFGVGGEQSCSPGVTSLRGLSRPRLGGGSPGVPRLTAALLRLWR